MIFPGSRIKFIRVEIPAWKSYQSMGSLHNSAISLRSFDKKRVEEEEEKRKKKKKKEN